MRLVVRVLGSVVVLLAVSAVALVGWGWHAGYRLYVVHTGSMEPGLRPGDAVLDRPAPSSVRPGEVVTFAVGSGPDAVVTHRVASYSGGVVRTKGDANETVDPWRLHLSQVVGAVDSVLPRAGYVVVYLKQPQGLASLVTALLGLVLLWGLFFPTDLADDADTPAGGRVRLGGAPTPHRSPRRVPRQRNRSEQRHRAP